MGDIAWAMGAVPVKRAQDDAHKGIGKITISKKEGPDGSEEGSDVVYLVNGHETTFTAQLRVGDKIRPPRTSAALKVKEIQNDSTLILDGAGANDGFEPFDEPRSFDVLKRVDQKQVYEKVLQKIATGGAIGKLRLVAAQGSCSPFLYSSQKNNIGRHLSGRRIARSNGSASSQGWSGTDCLFGS